MLAVDTDETLAHQLQTGDKDALSSLVMRHHNALIGYLYRMCGGNRPLAEDLAQETFLRVICSIQQYTYPRSFKAWLYAIATNLVRDHHKRAETRYVLNDISEDEYVQSNNTIRPEAIIESDEEVSHLLDALMQLSEFHRAVIIMRYHEALPLNDIATALDIPLGTVKSRLSKGLHKLRQLMQKELEHDPE